MRTLFSHPTLPDCLVCSNRTSNDNTLLFGATPAECMSVWEAARCTSAAPPYFEPLRWRGKWLLDGALKLNCPAARAFSEAEDIWRGKKCDILLSLGTGTTPNRSPTEPCGLITVGTTVASDMMDEQKTWGLFLGRHPQSRNLRLNPIHRSAFTLDDVKNLKNIQTQTEQWILTKEEEVNIICDRLIAALFFFSPSSEIRGGVLVGKIFCRLPPTEGSKLIDRILQKAELPLFTVKYNGETPVDIIVGEAFGDPSSSDDPCFVVTCLGDTPTTGDIKVDVEMRSLQQTKSPWLPISGSPYTIHRKFDELQPVDALARVREPRCISSSFD